MRFFGAWLLLLAIFLSSCLPADNWLGGGADIETSKNSEGYAPKNFDNVKAIWLSQYDLSSVYTDGGRQRERESFAQLVRQILGNISSLGLNTVFLQVRPFGDSFFESEVYPVSSFVSGEYGNPISYDPIAIIIDEGHRLGLSMHAWINPLRCMNESEIVKVDDDFLIKRWYNDRSKKGKYIVNVSQRYYLNPAYDEVRELVCLGVDEILEKYEVDGIHIDDYFYPTADESFDSFAYAEYLSSGGGLSLGDFRRENINLLVGEIYRTVKSKDARILFGVSPAGVMKNNRELIFADVEHWCANEGYVDYICPQIYFGFEHSTCAFDKLCREFSEMIKVDGVRLIVGMTLGKAHSEYDAYAGEGKYEWRDRKDILVRQLEYAKSLEKCVGVSYFSYQYFYDALTGEPVGETRAELDKLLPELNKTTWRKQ